MDVISARMDTTTITIKIKIRIMIEITIMIEKVEGSISGCTNLISRISQKMLGQRTKAGFGVDCRCVRWEAEAGKLELLFCAVSQ